MMKRISNLVIILFFLLFTFVLLLPFIDTKHLPMINLLAVFVPYVLILQLPFILTLVVFKRWWLAGMSLVIILLSYTPIDSTWNWQHGNRSEEGSQKVISYNTSFFNVTKVFKKDYFDMDYPHTVGDTRDWLLDQEADIVCIQEFFNDKNSDIYNTIEAFEIAGYNSFIFSKPKHDNGLQRGLATFVKYPIVASGVVFMSSNDYNGAIYTDLKLSVTDTIRMINVHLKSTAFRSKEKSKIKKTLSFIREYSHASYERSLQTEQLITFIRESPYPVVVAGDFNETPYSNSYSRFENELANAFESVGEGTGISYPFFDNKLGVRIDHVFTSSEIESISFKNFTQVHYSEHFPIMAIIRLNKPVR